MLRPLDVELAKHRPKPERIVGVRPPPARPARPAHMLLIGALFALHIQVQVRPNRERRTVVRDSIVDTATTAAGRRRLVGHRLPVTAEVLATAFKDPAARPLLLRARAARLAQDSALTSYDATAYQRLSVFMSFTEAGRKRPMFINESAIRVQWKRDVGAWVDMRGARSAIPLAPPEEADDELRGDLGSDMMSPIPYFPGYEPLWIGGTTARAQVDDGDIVHPLAEGAEAYYRYETGDSLSFTLRASSSSSSSDIRARSACCARAPSRWSSRRRMGCG